MKIQAGVPTDVEIDPRAVLRLAGRIALAAVGLDPFCHRLSEDGVYVEEIDKDAIRAGRRMVMTWKTLREATDADLDAFFIFDHHIDLVKPSSAKTLAVASVLVERRDMQQEWVKRQKEAQLGGR